MDALGGFQEIPRVGKSRVARPPQPPKNCSEAKEFFEFFRKGSHREVLFLGELVETPVHFVKSKNHKVLCGARVGRCPLCEIAATSDDVSNQQLEYNAPAFVRQWNERDYLQQVAVFSNASYGKLCELFPADSVRGQRAEVLTKAHGNSVRYAVKALDGLPRGFPSTLPASFDVVPFIRARFGLPPDPARPMVLLPSFRCDGPGGGAAGTLHRPKPMPLTPADCVAVAPWMLDDKAPAERERFARACVANGSTRILVELLKRYPELDAVIADENKQAANKLAVTARELLGDAVEVGVEELPRGELATIELSATPEAYGPKTPVANTPGDGRLVSPAGREMLSRNRAADARRTVAAVVEQRRDGQSNNASAQPIDATLDQLAAMFAPSANGQHKNGGAQ